jgi:hypothetical protein
MNNYFIGVIIFIVSIFIFYLLVKLFEFIPKHYHRNIQLIGSLSIIIVISGTFLTYFKEKQEQKLKANKDYADNILKNFDDIDNLLINNYDKFNAQLILNILYNKIQIPSSGKGNIHDQVINMDTETKDMLFLIYNKLTSLFEKMYLTNIELFNNDNLGIKVRMFIDTIFYYEFWSSTKYSYNKNFVNFIQDKYIFLTLTDYKYFKPDRVVANLPYINDASFIYESPKYDKLWYIKSWYDKNMKNKGNGVNIVNVGNTMSSGNGGNTMNDGNTMKVTNTMNGDNGGNDGNNLYSGYNLNDNYTEYNKM